MLVLAHKVGEWTRLELPGGEMIRIGVGRPNYDSSSVRIVFDVPRHINIVRESLLERDVEPDDKPTLPSAAVSREGND